MAQAELVSVLGFALLVIVLLYFIYVTSPVRKVQKDGFLDIADLTSVFALPPPTPPAPLDNVSSSGNTTRVATTTTPATANLGPRADPAVVGSLISRAPMMIQAIQNSTMSESQKAVKLEAAQTLLSDLKDIQAKLKNGTLLPSDLPIQQKDLDADPQGKGFIDPNTPIPTIIRKVAPATAPATALTDSIKNVKPSDLTDTASIKTSDVKKTDWIPTEDNVRKLIRSEVSDEIAYREKTRKEIQSEMLADRSFQCGSEPKESPPEAIAVSPSLAQGECHRGTSKDTSKDPSAYQVGQLPNCLNDNKDQIRKDSIPCWNCNIK